MVTDEFFHDLLRKQVVIFGTLFNNIFISRSNGTDAKADNFRVPISYGPREKFMALTEGKPGSAVQAIQLPRMSFEWTGMQPDPTRKFSRLQRYTENGVSIHEPTPWNINFQLNIMTKNNIDAAKIVEQILPFFNPDWTVSAKLIEGMDRTWDIPVVFSGITHEDQYEGNFDTRRMIIVTIDFVLRGYFSGPQSTRKLIKFVTANLHGSMTSTQPDLKITVQPGLTSNGQPTFDVNQSIPYQNVNAEDDYAVIVSLEDYDWGT